MESNDIMLLLHPPPLTTRVASPDHPTVADLPRAQIFDLLGRREDDLRRWGKKWPVGMIHNVAKFIRSSPQKRECFERISRENDEAQEYLLAGLGSEGGNGQLWEVMTGMKYLLDHLEDRKLFYHAVPDEATEENTNSQVELARGRPDRNRQIPARFRDCEIDIHPRKSMQSSLPGHGSGQRDDGSGKPSGSSEVDDMKKDLRRYLRLPIITAWQKLNEYSTTLRESPLFAASTILHPSLGQELSEDYGIPKRAAENPGKQYAQGVGEEQDSEDYGDGNDLADYRASRKLQDFYLYYGRWHGKDGSLPREKYIFPIDKEELARLDILHKFFFVVRKNNLFSASLDVEQPLRVLDLGTGTGIWAIELSEKYPHMHVQGLDFNMIQPKMIPRTMTPPKPFDLEGSWETVDVDWDFMHVRTLFGIRHLKPGYGYMEQVEIDWAPQCDDDSLPTDSALSQWASKLLDAMDQYGRPMRVNTEKTRQQLALAGFVDISETVIRACYNPWPEDATEKEAARWFNMGLSSGLTALSCAPM
ncbi:hypothetical protein ACKAV7_003649 [Fusarium commune]